MERAEELQSRGMDLVALRDALATLGWGYFIGFFVCGPVLVSGSTRVGVLSIVSAVVVVAGLVKLPLEYAPAEFAPRRQVVIAAMVLGWACTVASFFPGVGPVTQVVGPISSATAVVLFSP